MRFIAPTGFEHGIKPGVLYTRLPGARHLGMIQMVGFYDTKAGGHAAHFVRLPMTVYDRGLRREMGKEVPLQIQPATTLPYWHVRYEGKDLDKQPELTRQRRLKKGARKNKASQTTKRVRPGSVEEEVHNRFASISVAVEEADRILNSEDPEYELNKLARACVPPVNETRYRLFFWLWIAHDYNTWALMPDRSRNGRWKRTDEKYKESLFGADKKHAGGIRRCWTPQTMIDTMVAGFDRHAKKAGTLMKAYSATIRIDFGGRVEMVEVVGANGRKSKRPVAFHKHGRDLPSYDKFRYYVYEVLGAPYVRRKLGDDLTEELKNKPYEGSLSQDLGWLGQEAFFDSRNIKERPKGYLGNYHLAAMMAVDLIDGASHHIDGLGFSLGAEDWLGYSLALFCAAIDKVKFGQIVGVTIAKGDWDSKGLHRKYFSDRGAGCAEVIRNALKRWLISFGMARSYTPKDDALVETKHPRRHRKKGKPTIVLSDLTVLEIIRREVLRVILKNRTDTLGDNVPDEAVVNFDVKSPGEFRRFLLEEWHRDDLIQISFSDAVRAFLPKVIFQGDSNGRLTWKGKVYNSKEMTACGLAQEVWDNRRGGDYTIEGYVYPWATRYTWVEFKGQLIEVEVQGNDKPEVKNASLPEREEIEKARGDASGFGQAMRPYEIAYTDQAFKDETGKEPDAGHEKSGKFTPTPEAQDEMRHLKSLE
jgi:hypothetical protein